MVKFEIRFYITSAVLGSPAIIPRNAFAITIITMSFAFRMFRICLVKEILIT